MGSLYVPESEIVDYKGFTNKLCLIIEINPKSKILTSCEVIRSK